MSGTRSNELRLGVLHFVLFGLFLITLVPFLTNQSFAQVVDPITIYTDKTSYKMGDTLHVKGEVKELLSGFPVTLQIIDPVGNLVTVKQLEVSSSKVYYSEITIDDKFKYDGTYTAKVMYGTESRTDKTTFDVTSKNNPTPDVIPTPYPDKSNDSELEQENHNLKAENKKLQNQINVLNERIDQLNKKIDDLNMIVKEQLKVLYDWVISRK